jgi:aspartate carbamoyltransferase catalytic subunit
MSTVVAEGLERKRDLIAISDLSADDVRRILDLARGFQSVGRRAIKKVPALRGRTVVLLFYEASTRTLSSFDLAAKRLSADTVAFRAAGSSIEKGESLKDTVLTLTAYRPDAIVIRHPHAGAAAFIARYTDAAVINAGDGQHQHPSQCLLDLLTIEGRLGTLEGKRIWIVGDVLHSRVARSNAQGFTLLGAHVTLAGPPSLIPREAETLGVDVRHDLSGMGEADVVYVLRMQQERQAPGQNFVPSLREYVTRYQVNHERLRPGQIVMHPGPVNRGVELSAALCDDPRTLMTEQVEAGLVVRMAILYDLLATPDGA